MLPRTKALLRHLAINLRETRENRHYSALPKNDIELLWIMIICCE